MRFVKFAVIGLLTLFLVLTAISLLFPSHLRISRVVNVPTTRARTAVVLADLHSWEEWNSFIRNVPLTNKHFSSPAYGAGATLYSDEYTIRETAADTNGIALQWDLKGGKQYAGGFDLLSTGRDSLVVQWWFDLHFRWYPWEKMGAFVYDRKLGPAMEESLDSLRGYLEKSR
jgi:hypothetical protein